MHHGGTITKKIALFLGAAAIALFLCILVPVALSALRVTATSIVALNRMNQEVLFARDSLLPNLLVTAVAVLAYIALHALLERFAGVRFGAAVSLLWAGAAVCLVLAVGLVQRADSMLVINAAKKFAAGDYSPLRSVYFNRVSYQLGICLPLEVILRLFPSADVNLVMQCLNCVMSVAVSGMLAVLAGMLAQNRSARSAAMLLYLTFLPMLLFCMFVYGTLPMLLLCAGAMLCFVRYTQTKRKSFALAYALLVGVAVVVKPNTFIPMLALAICAVVYALESGDLFLPACAALSFALGIALPDLVVMHYELRAGVELAQDTGMLLRLAMGLQDSMIAAGWYNGMIEEFWPLEITPQMEHAGAVAALEEIISAWRAEPAQAGAFFAEKCLSQWAEPAYDILWYGAACPKGGRFNGLAHMLFRDGSGVRAMMEGYMNIFQQAMYLLTCVGTVHMLAKRRVSAVQLMLPVTIIGGFLYHMLFEAKSQYIYTYAIFMIPLAAQGLTVLEGALRSGIFARRAKMHKAKSSAAAEHKA